MKLALDAMGGDDAPTTTVEGAVLFAREFPEHQVVLVGDLRALEPLLPKGTGARGVPSNLSLHPASQVVEMGEHATASLRRKKDSSLRVCFDLVKSGTAQAAVSAGNSGAVMALGLLTLGRVPGVERPAIATLFPALKQGRCLLLDAGANVECRPSQLAQFAVMGETYVRKLLGVTRPRVALLANGEEETKGTALTRSAAELLKRSDLHYVGYVEGKDIFDGTVDVVVTDGFTGNIVLKTTEGAASALTGLIRNAIENAGIGEKLGALLLQGTFAGLKKVTDSAEIGGAPLLGLNGVGIVAHGRSSAKAVKNALRAAMEQVDAGLFEELSRRIASASAWLPAKETLRQKGVTSEGL
ncbi:MAG: phosphate acyltransferase PlsX [Myxococcota bacterium]|nr:phosphate acyltransferase PlsX [Myxococcota bacterium]